jgi:hypothetical protein
VKVGIAVIDHGAGLGRPAAYLSDIRRGGTFVGTRVRSAAFFCSCSAQISSVYFLAAALLPYRAGVSRLLLLRWR